MYDIQINKILLWNCYNLLIGKNNFYQNRKFQKKSKKTPINSIPQELLSLYEPV